MTTTRFLLAVAGVSAALFSCSGLAQAKGWSPGKAPFVKKGEVGAYACGNKEQDDGYICLVLACSRGAYRGSIYFAGGVQFPDSVSFEAAGKSASVPLSPDKHDGARDFTGNVDALAAMLATDAEMKVSGSLTPIPSGYGTFSPKGAKTQLARIDKACGKTTVAQATATPIAAPVPAAPKDTWETLGVFLGQKTEDARQIISNNSKPDGTVSVHLSSLWNNERYHAIISGTSDNPNRRLGVAVTPGRLGGSVYAVRREETISGTGVDRNEFLSNITQKYGEPQIKTTFSWTWVKPDNGDYSSLSADEKTKCGWYDRTIVIPKLLLFSPKEENNKVLTDMLQNANVIKHCGKRMSVLFVSPHPDRVTHFEIHMQDLSGLWNAVRKHEEMLEAAKPVPKPGAMPKL